MCYSNSPKRCKVFKIFQKSNSAKIISGFEGTQVKPNDICWFIIKPPDRDIF